MAVRTITTRLELDGDAQFKEAMSSVNSALRTLKSEIALSEAQFKGQVNTVEALTAKNKLLTEVIDQQKEKVKALEQAVKDSIETYGENSKTTDKYQTQLNRAKAELIELDRELVNNGKYLKEARDSAGGTAMPQTLTAMEKAVASGGDKLEQFAQIAGMSAGEFAQAWGQDPMTAITAFTGGLGQLDEQGESATQVLEELGLSGIRQSNMLKALALANDTLVSALDTANAAWGENAELAATAAGRYGATEAKMAMTANAVNNLKIAIGDALAPALGTLAEGAVPVISAIETVIQDHPQLIQAITGLVTVVGLLTAGVTAYNVLVPIATAVTGALAAALNLLPFVGIATAIGAAIAGLAKFVSWLNRIKEEAEDFTESVEGMEDAAGELFDGLDDAAESALSVSEAAEQAQASAEAAAPALDGLTASTKELEKATLAAAGAADTYTAALKEQEKSGTLSLKTTNELIEAGYQSALVIDQETGAVTLNREEYIRLASAKIQDQIATLENTKATLESKRAMDEAAAAMERFADTSWEAAYGRAAAAYADNVQALDLQIAALNRAMNSLNSYGSAATAAARKSSSASKKIETQAEGDLQTYKDLKAALDHEKAVELVDEAEYYRQLAGYHIFP